MHCDNQECRVDKLCERCLALELKVKARQAEVIGQEWAEKVCRTARFSEWPKGPHVTAVARLKVQNLSRDRRLLGRLAEACERGAAAWWERRPERYRAT